MKAQIEIFYMSKKRQCVILEISNKYGEFQYVQNDGKIMGVFDKDDNINDKYIQEFLPESIYGKPLYYNISEQSIVTYLPQMELLCSLITKIKHDVVVTNTLELVIDMLYNKNVTSNIMEDLNMYYHIFIRRLQDKSGGEYDG